MNNQNKIWENRKLGDVCEIIAGQAPPSKFYNTEGKGKPFLKVNSFGRIYPKIDTWTTQSLKEAREEDVLFSVAGSLGLVNLGINACITRSIFALRPKKGIILQKFLFYLLKILGKQVANEGQGSAQKIITINQLKNLWISVPLIEVQQKIVEILDTVENMIEIQERIIEKTKELKKSLMADLFKFGLPAFRKGRKLKKTEIGEIPEDWQIVRLGEVVKIDYGIQAAVSKLKDSSIGTPILTNKNITNEGKIELKDLNYYPLPKREIKRYLLRKGDLIFNWRSGSIEHVGKTALFNLEGDFTFSSFILRFRPQGKIDPLFLKNYLFWIRNIGFLKIFSQQSSINQSLNAGIMSTFPIPLPSLTEQKEIAEILQTVDEKIEIGKKEKELYEELFKAFLNKIMKQEIDVEKIEI